MAPKWLFWPAPAGGGTDVTPDAIDWEDAFSTGGSTSTSATISGIDTTITLSVSWSTVSATPENYYQLNGGLTVFMDTNPFTFPVVNGDVILFTLVANGGPSEADFTVSNASDGNVILDTFNLFALDA
jgi:hypothetical protein